VWLVSHYTVCETCPRLALEMAEFLSIHSTVGSKCPNIAIKPRTHLIFIASCTLNACAKKTAEQCVPEYREKILKESWWNMLSDIDHKARSCVVKFNVPWHRSTHAAKLPLFLTNRIHIVVILNGRLQKLAAPSAVRVTFSGDAICRPDRVRWFNT